MKLHLVGGFLGSGKTTGIINAARQLMARGQRVGVVTNDQGKYLVDTSFYKLADLPTVEVTGGCFCCNYDDLDARLDELIESAHPDVIFAESVGSCADLVATVIKPLLELGKGRVSPYSFSVFSDARLLRRRLLNLDMPFSDDVMYIYDHQIEEAGLLIVNKIDLLSAAQLDEMRELVKSHYSEKRTVFMNSFQPESIARWINAVDEPGEEGAWRSLDLDYTRYGRGEALMGWLDEELDLEFPSGEGQAVLRTLIADICTELAKRQAAIGHMKFILRSIDGEKKISVTSLEEQGWEDRIPVIHGNRIQLLVNARVEMDASELYRLVQGVVGKMHLKSKEERVSFFQPARPNPTYHMD